jgi:SAM-dependent methyltransferase
MSVKTTEWTGIKALIGAYHFKSSARKRGYADFQNKITDAIQGNEIVMDLGSGTGALSIDIAKNSDIKKMICLDISRDMLNRLEKKAEILCLKHRIEVIHSDASSTGLEAGSVDIVISNGLLHELHDPSRGVKIPDGSMRLQRHKGCPERKIFVGLGREIRSF